MPVVPARPGSANGGTSNSQQSWRESYPRSPLAAEVGTPQLIGSKKLDVELALAAVNHARGGYVWTAEAGAGKSTLLDLIVAELSRLTTPKSCALVRLSAPRFADAAVENQEELEGTAIDTLATQLFRSDPWASEPAHTGHDAPETDPFARRCAAVSSTLIKKLADTYPGVTCVVVVDDFDGIDLLSQEVLITLVTQRRVPVVLLATANDQFDGRGLPHPIVLRRLNPTTAVDALQILDTEHPDPTSPRVVATLTTLLNGNIAAILETARELSPDQLRGAALLSDPLPVVPALHALHDATLDALSTAERKLLLRAAVAVVDRTSVLLSAARMEMSDVLDRPIAHHLHFVGGRFTFPDARLRSLAHGAATLAERTAAHWDLADAHTRAGDEAAATWHTALATLAGDAALAPKLLTLAESLLAQGELERAHRVAREALSQGAPEVRAHAQAITGMAALGAGFVIDAVDSLRQAMRWGDSQLRARLLAGYVEAVTLYEGQVPDAILSQAINAMRSGTPGAAELTNVIAATTAAARLHAERGDGPTARHLLGTAHDLLIQLELLVPPTERVHDGKLTPHIGRARTDIGIAEACAAVHGTNSSGGPFPAPRNFDASADSRGLVASYRALALALAGHPDEASRVLTDALAEVAHIDSASMWSAGSDVSASPLVEAHLMVAHALVDFWAGRLESSVHILVEAAQRLPIELPFAGLVTALLARLSTLGQTSATLLGSTLSETGIAPASRPVRFGILVDRALSASFEGRRTEASALLELAGEQGAPSGSRFLPLPGLGTVETWLEANQMDSAHRAFRRLQAETKQSSDTLRRCALVRAEVALADLSDPDVYGHVVEITRSLRSPYERARTEYVLGRNLLRARNTAAAHMHLVTATELFEQAGAPAWSKVTRRELARLLEDSLEVTSHRSNAMGSADLQHTAPAAMSFDANGLSTGAAQRHEAAAATSQTGDGASDGPMFSPTAPGENASIAASLARWKLILTEREFDVATLVAQGRSNREVAEMLFLSIRTVEVHLGKVFRKLGVTSRLELAVLAHRT